MTDKEKVYAAMVEAVRNCDPSTTCLTCRYRTETDCMEKITADYLVDNGIGFAKTAGLEIVRCGECVHRGTDSWCEYVDEDPEFFCSRGERRDDV